MTIFNRGKPRHAKPRRRLAAMLAAVLTAMALVFAQGVAFAASGTDIRKWQGCVGRGQAATAKASGVNFGFVKVTEGNGYTDSVADCTMQSLLDMSDAGTHIDIRPIDSVPLFRPQRQTRVHNQPSLKRMAIKAL